MSTSDTLAFNPFLPEVHEDPYPMYDRLRTEEPVHRSALGVWVLLMVAVPPAPSTALVWGRRRGGCGRPCG